MKGRVGVGVKWRELSSLSLWERVGVRAVAKMAEFAMQI
jgi:hypothetical protein